MPDIKENTEAYLKLVGVAKPVIARITKSTTDGIWLQSDTLHMELALAVKQPGVPGFVSKAPRIFLPLHQIEWMMVPAEKAS